ncbi:hypothetical protein FK521_26930, partial [Klebsiella pneumoniae]|nr:hypothetical protein [Klebsiella pneumoniae]
AVEQSARAVGGERRQLSGMIFLGETLKLSQTLALGAIIIASMGATLTMQRAPPRVCLPC